MGRRSGDALKNMIAVDIQAFRKATRDIQFDVYLKLGDENFAHVFSRSTGLDYKRLATYIQKGTTQLYIHSDDRGLYDEFVSSSALQIFKDSKTPHEKRVAALLNMTEQNMAELFTSVSVSDETAENTQQIVRGYVDLMLEKPQTLSLILKLVSHGEYLYYHSIAVAIFSMFVAKASGNFTPKMLETVGLGGFLHDIGYTQIAPELLNTSEELTAEQWKEIHDHPRLGLKMLEGNSIIADEVRFIVYQHHEQPNGQGYPNGLHGPVIFYPAKIVGLVDAFSALISNRPFRPAYTVEQALQILGDERGKWDRDLLKVMNSVFLKRAAISSVA